MFRKSDYLFHNYNRSYVAEECPDAFPNCQDVVAYENPRASRQSLALDLDDSKLAAHCRACNHSKPYLEHPFKCCSCNFSLCGLCGPKRLCFHCRAALCPSCCNEGLIQNQYVVICEGCLHAYSNQARQMFLENN